MDLEGIKAKWNKSDRKGQIIHDLTYMWDLKNKTKQKKKKTLRCRKNKQTNKQKKKGCFGEGASEWGGGGKKEKGI